MHACICTIAHNDLVELVRMSRRSGHRSATRGPITARRAFVGILAFFQLLSSTVAWHRLVDQTFAAPFKKIDSAGNRLAGEFRTNGDSKILEHFIRLTADRQSKQGYLWGAKQVNTENWSVNLGFRVSGQGKTLFGDGLVFWYTDMTNPKSGKLFGVDSKFKGFAVILDTFKNHESAHVHKDISVLRGTGEDSLVKMNEERSGCDGNVRFWEGKDSFKPQESRSHLKITLKDRVLTVTVDEVGDGKFRSCFTAQNVLPADFDLQKAFFGLSASTGQLADNHDVLFFQAYELEKKDLEGPDPELHHSVAPEDPMKPEENPEHEDYDPELALRKVISKTDTKTQKMFDDLKHEIDHKLIHMKDDLTKVIGKLGKQEKQLEGRVKTMEDEKMGTVVEELKNHLESRLDEIGGVLSDSVEKRLQELEAHFEIHHESIKLDIHSDLHADLHQDMVDHTNHVLKEQMKKLASKQGGWFWPAILVMLAIGTCVGGVYMKLNNEMKKVKKGSWLD